MNKYFYYQQNQYVNFYYKFQIIHSIMQILNRQIKKCPPQLTKYQCTIDLLMLINKNISLSQYFQQNAHTLQQYSNLAVELLIEAVNKRKHTVTQNMRNINQDKVYNVAYVKHNRFLSPSQKKQITPKVTEIIPISPQKIIIYGKPKIKLDDGYGCQLHGQNCEQFLNQSQNDQENSIQQQKNESTKQPYNHHSNYQIEQEMEGLLPRKYQEFLSPKSNQKQNKKTKKTNKKINSSKIDNKTILINNQHHIISPNNKNNSSQVNRFKSPKSTKNHFNNLNENYGHVQSKIKDQIQRDKKNREFQKKLQEQKQQIEDIYSRQQQLLMMQKYQKQLLDGKGDYRNYQLYQNSQKQLKQSQNSEYEHSYKIRAIRPDGNKSIDPYQFETSSISSFSSDEVNLHGHLDRNSRIKCYDCEIQRLRLRKQRAKLAIKQLEDEQNKRNIFVEQMLHVNMRKDKNQKILRQN